MVLVRPFLASGGGFVGPDLDECERRAHEHARRILPPGTRYEIRESVEPVAVAWVADTDWDDGRPWEPVTERYYDAGCAVYIRARETT